MESYLCSTLLNAADHAPDFPADISAFVADRPKEESAKNVDVNVKPRVDAAASVSDWHSDIRSLDCSAAKQFRIAPSPWKSEADRRRRVADLRTTNLYLDKLERMRSVLDKSRVKAESADHPAEVPTGDKPTKTNRRSAEGDCGGRSAVDAIRTFERVLQKSAVYHDAGSRLENKDHWNQDGVGDVLCPKRMEDDVAQLERVVARLDVTTQRIPKMAVRLQKPPAPCLQLEPRFHEAATKVLGGESIAAMAEVINAADEIDQFVRATSEEEGASTAVEVANHLEREKNYLEHIKQTVDRALVAHASLPEAKFGRKG